MITPPKELSERFKQLFDVELFNFKEPAMMMATGKFFFNLIMFDEYCHKRLGYSEKKHGSLKSFIKKEHGQAGVDLIERLNKEC